MAWLEILLPYLETYALQLYFLAGLFTGEGGIILLMVLVVEGSVPFWPMILLFLLGAFVIDNIVYFIATRMLSKLNKWKIISKGSEKLGSFIDKYVKGEEFYAILIAKFIQGTNFVLLVYLSIERLSYKKYIKYDIISLAIWAVVMTIIGWTVGQGFVIVLTIFKSIQLAIIFLILIFVILHFSQKWIRKIFKWK